MVTANAMTDALFLPAVKQSLSFFLISLISILCSYPDGGEIDCCYLLHQAKKNKKTNNGHKK